MGGKECCCCCASSRSPRTVTSSTAISALKKETHEESCKHQAQENGQSSPHQARKTRSLLAHSLAAVGNERGTPFVSMNQIALLVCCEVCFPKSFFP